LYLQGIGAIFCPPPPAPAKSPNPSYLCGVVRWGERWVFWFGFLGFFRAVWGVWRCVFFGFGGVVLGRFGLYFTDNFRGVFLILTMIYTTDFIDIFGFLIVIFFGAISGRFLAGCCPLGRFFPPNIVGGDLGRISASSIQVFLCGRSPAIFFV